MGIFDSVAADDARFAFCDADAMGAEAITYTAKGSSTSRTIYGLVDRDPAEPDDDGVLRPVFSILVENHNTRGIDASRTDVIGGTVSIKRRPGTTDTELLTIAAHNLRADAGAVLLRWPRA